jgi:crotonobetainyl-CoA:carnitine CoA-transferase CaiB-like acyl-CoA transferase
VLTFSEARTDPHKVARGTHLLVGQIQQPGLALRFSRMPGKVRGGPPKLGQFGHEALADWGYSATQIPERAKQGMRFSE